MINVILYFLLIIVFNNNNVEQFIKVGGKGQEKGQGKGCEEGCKVIGLTSSSGTGINFYAF